MNKLTYGILIGTILGIVLYYILTQIRQKCFIGSNVRQERDNTISVILRQMFRWLGASLHDRPDEEIVNGQTVKYNALIKVLHANYAVSLLDILNQLYTDQEVTDVAGISLQEISKNVYKGQDEATKTLLEICPTFGPKPSLLTYLAGQGIPGTS